MFIKRSKLVTLILLNNRSVQVVTFEINFEKKYQSLCFVHLRHSYCIMHQSIPAAPSVPRPPGLLQGICPPCQSWGRGICKFCAARGLGSCQPQSSDTCGFLSEYNYTDDFTGKTSRLAHLSMKRKIVTLHAKRGLMDFTKNREFFSRSRCVN